MFNKKLLALAVAGIITLNTFSIASAAPVQPQDKLETIDCGSDAVFAANSCNQCFSAGEQTQGYNIVMAADTLINNTTKDLAIKKEDQVMPKMINLAGDKVLWNEKGNWEYTTAIDKGLVDPVNSGSYVAFSNTNMEWIKMGQTSAVTLDKNTAAKGENIGLYVYTLNTRSYENGVQGTTVDTHKECVLYKSANVVEETPVIPETKPVTPKVLPKTGPETIFFIMISLIAPVLIMRRKNK